MREEQFERFLQEDLSWRKKEISELYLMAETSEQNEILLKSFILILYSHWEGYVKKGSKLYLKFVSEKKKRIKDLTTNFRGIHLKSLAKSCIENLDSSSLGREIEFITKYTAIEDKKFKLSINPDNDREMSVIETGHNLNPKILRNILNLIGANYCSPLESREQYLNSNLLDSRNAISHGSKVPEESYQDFSLHIDQVRKLKEVVVVFLDFFQETLIDYQNNEYYLVCNEELKNEYDDKKSKELKERLENIEKS